MKTRTFNVTLNGKSPLLMHRDDVEWREQMDAWLKVPENKKASKAGDDRFPPYRWIGGCYHDGKQLAIPSDNLMTLLREGASKVASGGKNGETFKRLSQACLIVDQIAWPVIIGADKVVWWADIEALMAETDFHTHCERAKALGFSLFVKPARVGQSKHVRVRARFDAWTCSGTITSLDDRLDMEALKSILRVGGQFCGLCDWRPSAPKSPGRFGLFEAEVTHAR